MLKYQFSVFRITANTPLNAVTCGIKKMQFIDFFLKDQQHVAKGRMCLTVWLCVVRDFRTLHCQPAIKFF